MKVTIKRSQELTDKIEVTKVDDTLFAIVPEKMALYEVEKYLSRNAKSIADKFFAISGSQTELRNGNEIIDSTTSDFYTYKKCLICGKPVSVVRSLEVKKTELKEQKLYINDIAYHLRETRRKAIYDYLKRSAREILGRKVANYGMEFRLCPTKIDFVVLKGDAWFNCAEAVKNIITIDYRAIQLPERLQDYIIIHCFMHFQNENHGERFWRSVELILPNYRELRDELERFEFLKEL